MGNPISRQVKIGTIGELLVQLRLLQFGVQAAPPIKDSGNDLIAIRGETFRTIQVKATTKGRFQLRDLPKRYHLVALVDLKCDGNEIYLDASNVYLLSRKTIESEGLPKNVEPYRICQALVDAMF